MALIRGHHAFDDHFTQIPNAWLRDNRLTLEARGLLAQIMSHTPGWRLSIKSLAAQNHVGRDKIKRIIDELMKYGYLERSEKQEHSESGHLAGYSYTTKDPVEGVTQEPCKVEPDKAEPYKDTEALKNTITKNTIIKKTRSKRELHPIPDDWKPNESFYDDVRWTGLDIDDQAERFVNWHQAKGIENKDWQAAFRNWLKKAIDYRQKSDYRESELERFRREWREAGLPELEDE